MFLKDDPRHYGYVRLIHGSNPDVKHALDIQAVPVLMDCDAFAFVVPKGEQNLDTILFPHWAVVLARAFYDEGGSPPDGPSDSEAVHQAWDQVKDLVTSPQSVVARLVLISLSPDLERRRRNGVANSTVAKEALERKHKWMPILERWLKWKEASSGKDDCQREHQHERSPAVHGGDQLRR